MSSRAAAGRKRLQQPPPKVSPPEPPVTQPNSFTPTTHANIISSTPRSRNVPRIQTSVQRLDLSNEFTQPLPSPELTSPEYSPIFFPPSNHVNFRTFESNQGVEAVPSYGPFPHPQSNHRKAKWVATGEIMRTVPTYEPPSPYEEITYQSRRPQLRVDPHGTAFFIIIQLYYMNFFHIVVKYQKLPLPSPPGPAVHSRSPISPPKGSFPYMLESPISPKYSPTSRNNHSEYLDASYAPRSPSVRRSRRHSPTPSDLPEYRSIYSSYVDSHIPVALPNKSTRRDYQYTSYHLPSGSRNSPTSPHAQMAGLSISPSRNERRPPLRSMPSVPSSLNHSFSGSNPSSKRSPQDPYGDSTSPLSGYSSSGLTSPSTPTSIATCQPPAPPPSPNFFFPGSRSVARPRVTSKIAMSQLKKRTSKGRLRADRSQTSLVPSLSPVSPSVDQLAPETPPISPIAQTSIQSYHPDIGSDEGAVVRSEDSHRKAAPSVTKAPPEILVFPTSRSRAQPKISSKPKSSKRSSNSSKSKDNNSGRSRILGALFKKKNKGKPLNDIPLNNIPTSKGIPTSKEYPDRKLSDSVAPTVEHAPSEKRISEESSQESTMAQERTRKSKSRSGSYPLDPYNSVLLDKLSRLVLFTYLLLQYS